jgi:predicted secreted Zn-dependent protease
MLFPSPQRYLPRSGPGSGPASRREAKLQAEIAYLTAEVVRLHREQQIQLTRIAQIQQELDEAKRLLRELSARC